VTNAALCESHRDVRPRCLAMAALCTPHDETALPDNLHGHNTPLDPMHGLVTLAVDPLHHTTRPRFPHPCNLRPQNEHPSAPLGGSVQLGSDPAS